MDDEFTNPLPQWDIEEVADPSEEVEGNEPEILELWHPLDIRIIRRIPDTDWTSDGIRYRIIGGELQIRILLPPQ